MHELSDLIRAESLKKSIFCLSSILIFLFACDVYAAHTPKGSLEQNQQQRFHLTALGLAEKIDPELRHDVPVQGVQSAAECSGAISWGDDIKRSTERANAGLLRFVQQLTETKIDSNNGNRLGLRLGRDATQSEERKKVVRNEGERSALNDQQDVDTVAQLQNSYKFLISQYLKKHGCPQKTVFCEVGDAVDNHGCCIRIEENGITVYPIMFKMSLSFQKKCLEMLSERVASKSCCDISVQVAALKTADVVGTKRSRSQSPAVHKSDASSCKDSTEDFFRDAGIYEVYDLD